MEEIERNDARRSQRRVERSYLFLLGTTRTSEPHYRRCSTVSISRIEPKELRFGLGIVVP